MQITVAHDAGIALKTLEDRINDIEARVGVIVDLQAVEDTGEGKSETVSAHMLWNSPKKDQPVILKKEGEASPGGAVLTIAGTAYIEGVSGKAVIKVYRAETAMAEAAVTDGSEDASEEE